MVELPMMRFALETAGKIHSRFVCREIDNLVVHCTRELRLPVEGPVVVVLEKERVALNAVARSTTDVSVTGVRFDDDHLGLIFFVAPCGLHPIDAPRRVKAWPQRRRRCPRRQGDFR